MKIDSKYNKCIEVKEKEGLNFQVFSSLEKFGFLKSGFILGHENGEKIDSTDIPELISKVTEIPEKEFKVVIPKQVHQSGVRFFSERKYSGKEDFSAKVVRPEADALLSDQDNLFLVIQVADCLPVFLFDPGNKVFGLVHIGWRGAILGIAKNTVSHTTDLFNSSPKDLHLVFGPSIGKCCYEISDSLAILVEDKYIEKKGTEKYLDLNGYVKDRFLKTGIRDKNIFMSGECTFCRKEIYQSYRRYKDNAGRMVAFMGKVKNN